jgi:hypothetical protein
MVLIWVLRLPRERMVSSPPDGAQEGLHRDDSSGGCGHDSQELAALRTEDDFVASRVAHGDLAEHGDRWAHQALVADHLDPPPVRCM